MGNCSMCNATLDRLKISWNTQRYLWRARDALPDREIRRISRELRQELEQITLAGRTQGPYHTAHTEYALKQEIIIEMGNDLATELADLDREWNEEVENLRTQNQVDGRIIQSIAVRRHNCRESLTEQSWANFRSQHEGFMDELAWEYMRAAGITG